MLKTLTSIRGLSTRHLRRPYLTSVSSSASLSVGLLREKWVQPSVIKAVSVSTSPLHLIQPQEKGNEGHQGERIKPYEEIPTPKRIPVLNVSRDFLDIAKDPFRATHFMKKRVQEFGTIYREKMAPGFPEFLFVVNPEDIEKVFSADGKYPRRFSFEDWLRARMETGFPAGIFFLEGKEWHQQRTHIAKYMLVPRKVSEYHESFNEVALDMIKTIQREKSSENDLLLDVPSTFFKWSLESVSAFILGKRLGCLEEKVPQDCKDLIDAVRDMLAIAQDFTFKMSFHKYWPTKKWKKFVKCFDMASKIPLAHIEEKLADIKKEDAELIAKEEVPVGVDFITYMIYKGNMNLQEITANAGDLIGAAVDSTSLSLSWCLYSLATNPEVQEKLRSEVEKVVGSEEIVTPTHINNIPYLRDCIKETLRLYPAPTITRITAQEVILSGYRVPAGTHVYLPLAVSGTLPEYFKEPERFMPERWSRDNKDTPLKVLAFSSLPFGYGSRMCIGRRVAELELHIALAQLVRRFRFEYREDEPMNYLQKFFLDPERQLNIAFVDLK